MKILSQEPQKLLSLERAKQLLRISSTVDDSLIEQLIDAAIAKGEKATGRSLVEKEAQIEVENDLGVIDVPSPPTSTIDEVSYYDGSEWAVLTENSDYTVYGLDSKSISISTSYKIVQVTFTTGYENNADINRILYELIGVWYDNRPDVDMYEANIVSKLSKYKRWQAA